MKSFFEQRAKLLAVIWLIGCGVVLIVYFSLRYFAAEYRAFPSPDGNYRIVVYSISRLLPTMPGDGGSASGFVRLVDQRGNVLREKHVDRVMNIDQVDWQEHSVAIKLFTEWKLPERQTKGQLKNGMP